jgi:ATP-dependent exoDNAse (exonuclease V) beta subunit
MIRLNAEQEQAVTTRQNVVVSAGAGSGKTSVLTTRFLVVLLRNPDWRMSQVVAITFTRAAAFEMKGRIRQRLIDLLANPSLRAQFATWAGTSLSDDEQRERWQDLLKQMDSARIDTIHALCADILRANAPSTELDPRFAVLEEADARLLREQAYTHALNATEFNAVARGLFKHYDESTVKENATNASLLDALPDVPTYPMGNETGYDLSIAEGWDSLLRHVRAVYTQLKQAQGVLDFNDLEARTARLLQERDDVRARYRGADVCYVMVDEFQDTNPRQWQIVKALVDLHDGQARVFIVGDRKQSIYAFRGADVSVFKTAEEDIGNTIVMNTSYRANQALVAAINALFTQVFQDEAGGITYEPLAHARADAPIVPPMRATFYDVQKQKDEEVAVRLHEAHAIARHLKEAIEGDAPLQVYDKEKGTTRLLGYSDVGLLLRTMTQVGVYEEAFDAHGIPYVTISKRGYYARQEVADILNALQTLANPQDSLALASALRSPIFSLSDETLLRLRLSAPQMPLMHALMSMPADDLPADQRERLHDARDAFRELLPKVGRVTLAELLYALLTRTATLSKLQALGEVGVRARLNVEKLLALADAKSHLTLGDYTRYMQSLLTKQAQEGEATQDEAQGVRLMSVHNSKGLEFPLVILPYFENRSRDGKYPEVSFGEGGLVYKGKKDVPKIGKGGKELKEKLYHAHYLARQEAVKSANEAELKRLLYVAITRAQDAVWIYGKLDSSYGFWKCVGNAKDHHFRRITDETLLRWEERTLTPADTPAMPAISATPATHAKPAPTAPDLPLMARVPPPTFSESVRHISATQLGHLSVKHYANPDDAQENETRRISVTSLRQDLLGVAEDSGIDLHTPRVTRRIVGQMVHEAIRHRQFPSDNTPIDDILASYGWRFSLTDEEDLRHAVASARQLLENFAQSEVYSWLTGAQQVFLELPFIYPTQAYIVHGQIDMLLQGADGAWRIVDYKTSHVPKPADQKSPPTLAQATQHARLYQMQLAAYAGAVRANFHAMGQDVLPLVYVHYIRYGHTVEITPSAWQATLATFDGVLASALDMDV